MNRPALFTSFIPAILCCVGVAFAHGDLEKPLYVAEDGVDSGLCQDRVKACASIGYALGRAGKGGQIRVADGTYEISNTEDLFHLISGVIDVTGSGAALLTGVPFQYREMLEGRGFQIVTDRKGIEGPKAAEAEKLMQLHQQLKSSIAATPCSGGSAAGLPCDSVDLLSHVAFNDISASPAASSDVWGFVDLNTGREYAIAGFNIGTAVIDVTDPTDPREVGFVDGQNAVWRDMKVYQFFDATADRWKAYAYVTTDGSTDGLFIIDLTDLPHSISRVNYASDIRRAHNIYATNTDYATGLSLTGDVPTLVIAGSNVSVGMYRSYSLADPEAPVFISGGAGTGYMHDASSMLITDARKDTQCVNGGAYCEVLMDFNENTIELWDVTDSSNPVRLSNTPYANWGYVHSGWWSEDKQYIFVHDELDEQQSGLATTLRVFDVSNLTTPVHVGTWSGPTSAIDHNGFVRGNRYYMSNYSRGLTVLDISNPASPSAVGRLDTYPFSDSSSFVGAWGTYPFFLSGSIAISDIDSGFYLAADQTRDVAAGRVEFSSASTAVSEGQLAQLAVQRMGGTTGGISVDYEIVAATADAADYVLSTGTLSWAGGDGADKSIDITAVNDGVIEGMEQLLVRLVSPTGGATLGNLATASVYVSDPGSVSELSFSDSDIAMAERGFGMAIVTVKRRGSATGAASVDYSITGGSATPGTDFQGSTSGTINWATGDGDPKVLEFVLADDGSSEGDETFELTLSNPVGAVVAGSQTLTATIQDQVNVAPNAIAGMSQTRASGSQVTLNGSQSGDTNGDILSYQWVRTAGPGVALNNANAAVANFAAPTVTSDTMLQFSLTVSDPGGLSDTSATTVTITRAGSGGGSSGGSTGVVLLLILGSVLLARRLHQSGA